MRNRILNQRAASFELTVEREVALFRIIFEAFDSRRRWRLFSVDCIACRIRITN